MDSHIDIVISTYKKICNLDFEIYKELVLNYLVKYEVKSVRDITLLSKLFKLVLGEKWYYDSGNNEIVAHNTEDERFYPIAILDTQVDEINNEINLIQKSWSSTGDISKILFGLVRFKNIKENKSTDDDETKHLEYETILRKILNENNGTLGQNLVHLALQMTPDTVKAKVIEGIELKIYSHLAKSILNAEYLIFDNYKEKLNDIEKEFYGERDGEEIKIPGASKLYIEKSILMNSWYLQEACSSIGRYLNDNSTSNLLLVNADREKRFERKKEANTKFFGQETTQLFEKFIDSVIDMTVIDHCFKSNENVVEKLFQLCELISTFKSKSINDELFLEVCSEIEVKVSIMLDMILNTDLYHKHAKEENIDVDYYYIINSKKSKEEFLTELFSQCNYSVDKNYYLEYKSSHKNKKCAREDLIKECLYDAKEFSDLHLYHKAVKAGIEAHIIQSHVIEEIHALNAGEEKNSAKYQKIVNDLSELLKSPKLNLSPSFFRQSLSFMNEVITFEFKLELSHDRLNSINSYNVLFDRILSEMWYFIAKYESDIPFTYRPYFESSFYVLENGKLHFKDNLGHNDISKYNYEQFKGKFFFSSMLCVPLNKLYLTKLYDKYRLIYLSNIEKYKTENEKVVTTKIEDIDTQVTKFQVDSITKINNELESKSKELVLKNIEFTVGALGVFGSFIAFVTIAIGLTKVAKDLNQFILFASIFTTSLLLFATFLKCNVRFREKKAPDGHVIENSDWANFIWHLVVVAACSVAFFGIFRLISGRPQFEVDNVIEKQDSLKMRVDDLEKKLFVLRDSITKTNGKIDRDPLKVKNKKVAN